MTNRLESGSYDKYVSDHDTLSTIYETKRLSALIEQNASSEFDRRQTGNSVRTDVGGHQIRTTTPRRETRHNPVLAELVEAHVQQNKAIQHAQPEPIGVLQTFPSLLTRERAVGTNTEDNGKRQDDRLVEMYADLNSANLQLQSRLDCLENELSFAVKFIKTFWKGNPDASRTLTTRLESALAVVKVRQKT